MILLGNTIVYISEHKNILFFLKHCKSLQLKIFLILELLKSWFYVE